MSSASITFNENPDGVYYTGQTISGRVIVGTVEQKKIRGISIELKGIGEVRWSEKKTRETTGGGTEQHIVNYTANQYYWRSKSYILGSSTGPIFDYKASILTATFTEEIPRLPSSFEGEHGNIRYEFIVTIDQPYEDNEVFRKPFFLLENVNLDDDPSNKEPIRIENLKTNTRFCDSEYYIRSSCNIPMSGYFPGQKIPFHVHFENFSNKECSQAEIKLEKLVKFTATHPEIKSRTERTKILKIVLEPVSTYSNKDYRDFFELPLLPPTFTRKTHIINVSYCITVRALFSDYISVLCFPINVGTAPLPEIATNLPSTDAVQPTALETSDPPPPYIVQNPPSYEDALVLSEKFKELLVPKYPVNQNLNVGTSDILDMGLSNIPSGYPNTDWQGASAKPD